MCPSWKNLKQMGKSTYLLDTHWLLQGNWTYHFIITWWVLVVQLQHLERWLGISSWICNTSPEISQILEHVNFWEWQLLRYTRILDCKPFIHTYHHIGHRLELNFFLFKQFLLNSHWAAHQSCPVSVSTISTCLSNITFHLIPICLKFLVAIN